MDEELKKQIFKLSLILDSKSAEKNYVALRRAHYENIKWIHDHGLTEDYYEYMINNLEVQDG